MSQAANPILVEATRGEMVESFHRGRYVVMKADGTVIDQGGDIDALMYPRSAIKPLLAIPFLESGAIEAFGLEDKHIALACSSHNGEEEHAQTVKAWLERSDFRSIRLNARRTIHLVQQPGSSRQPIT